MNLDEDTRYYILAALFGCNAGAAVALIFKTEYYYAVMYLLVAIFIHRKMADIEKQK